MSDQQDAPERYTHGYAAPAEHFATRTAQKDAAFLLPHLEPGMSLLDCGCGPGSITVSIAEIVAPGHVVGIDIAQSMLGPLPRTVPVGV